MAIRSEFLLVLVVTVGAGLLRFWGLEALPPGLFHDEAYEGIDAWRILDGQRPIFLAENFGREPFYAYVMAPLIGLLGPTPLAVRSASALLGTLGVAVAYFWARVLFGRKLGLLVALLTAASYWHLHESRLGMRPIALPLFLGMTSGLVWIAARRGRRWAWPLAGLFLGLSFYTYLPARLFPLVVIVQVLLGVWAGERSGRSRRAMLGLASCLLVAFLVALPLLRHFQLSPEDAAARSGVVSVLATAEGRLDPIGAIAQNVVLYLGMFLWQGDETIRHNLPGRPVFDFLIAPFFLLGCGLSLIRRRAEHALIWVWLVVMLLPGLLSDSAPHFLRTIGIQPAIFLLPALGLAATYDWLSGRLSARWSERRARLLAGSAVTIVLVGTLLLTAQDYFVKLASHPDLDFYFDSERAELAKVAGDLPPGTRIDLPTPGWSYATIRFLRPRSFSPVQPMQTSGLRFGNNALLLGYTPAERALRPGVPGRVTLHWQALREIPSSLVESARVVDGFGRVWWQREGIPGLGTLPTDTWMPRESIADHLQIVLNEGTPAGEYELEIALSQPDGGRRTPVFEGSRQVGTSARMPGVRVER